MNNSNCKNDFDIDTFYKNNENLLRNIESIMSKDRFNHVKSVAKVSYNVSLKFNLTPIDAIYAGLLHDLAKDLNNDIQIEYAKRNKYYIENLPSFSLHAFASAFLAKEYVSINDNIYHAITFHCTGNENMSQFDKLIYTADKCEPTRNFDTKDILDLLYKDIDKAFTSELKKQKEYFESKNINYLSNEYTKNMYNYYKGEL